MDAFLAGPAVVVFRRPLRDGAEVLYASANTSIELGVQPEELYASGFASIVHPDDLPGLLSAFASRAEGEALKVRYRLLTSGGAVRWVEERNSPQAIDGASLERCLLVDVTPERQAEEEASALRRELERREEPHETRRASEEALRTLVDATPDIICFKDGEGRWIEANPADLELFELSGVDYRGKTDCELAPYSPFFAGPFNACMETDEAAWRKRGVSRGVERVARPDGTVKVYDILKVPVFHPDGSRKGLVVLGRDITEQSAAEEALRESERKLAMLIEILPAGVALFDHDGRATLVNTAAEQILGSPRAKLLGMGHDQLKLAPRAQPAPAGTPTGPCEQLFTHGETVVTYECAIERPDGSRRTLLVNSVRLEKETGSTLITFQDITERAELERLKTEFLTIASHELRTPLTSLTLLLGHLRRSPRREAPIDARTLERLQRQVRRLVQLVDTLLDVSRLDRGRLQLHLTETDAAALTRALVDDLRDQVPGRAFTIDVRGEPAIVLADPLRFEQVLSNLLDNALRYTPEGTPIDVTVEADAEQVRVAVVDHGPGIPRELQPRIFDKFFRPAIDVTARQPGLGLGLYISKQLIEMHGGELTCTTTPGEGSTFTVVLRRMR